MIHQARPWWRRGGRGRDDEAARDSRPQPEAATSDPDSPEPQVARLLELAAERATGALYLDGGGGGAVFLARGEVCYVASLLTPGVEALLLRPVYTDEQRWAGVATSLRRGESRAAVTAVRELLRGGTMSAVHIELLRRTAMADAAVAVLGPRGSPARARMRFRSGERHWCPATRTYAVADVLAEVGRRTAVLARLSLGVAPDRPVARTLRLSGDRIRLTANQWDVVRLADGTRTPVDIAWLRGHGVFQTTVAVHQLARLGLLTAGPGLAEQDVPGRHAVSFLGATVDAVTPGAGPQSLS
jgi:hypothetical protein